MTSLKEFFCHKDKNQIEILFITAMGLLLLIFIIAGIITHGESVSAILFHDKDDTFMDYFNSIMNSSDHPYTKYHATYPPLTILFYEAIGNFIIPFVDPTGYSEISFAIRESRVGMMSFLVISILTIYALYLITCRLTKKSNIRFGILFLLIFLLSYPFIFTLERGNNIAMAVAFSFVFLMGYRSENKWIRYLSYISLGFAAGFKLTPALFGLLILRERKWKEAAICGITGVCIVIGMFLFTEGSFQMLIDIITNYTTAVAGGVVINIKDMVFALFPGYSEELLNNISRVLLVIVLSLLAMVVIFDKKMKFWKIVTLISCYLVIGPGIGAAYLLVYMAIPLIYFLISERELTKNNILFLAGFIIIMCLIPWLGLGTVIGTFKAVAVLVMTVVLIGEGMLHIVEEIKEKNSQQRDSGTICE